MEINKRIPMKEETKQKISLAKQGVHVSKETEFKKGCIPWNKGKKMTKNIGNNHPKWKGGSSRYWANKIINQSNKQRCQCQICRTSGKTEIHHVNGKNTRFGGTL